MNCAHITPNNRPALRVFISSAEHLDVCRLCAPTVKQKYIGLSGVRLEELEQRATQGALDLTIGKGQMTQIEPDEWLIVYKLQTKVTFPPGSLHKHFVHALSVASQLSDRGRMYLAYIANRYRKQWTATDTEVEWIVRWGAWIKQAGSQKEQGS